MPDPGYRWGQRTEGLSEEHFSFASAGARVDAESHTNANSAGLQERDSVNTVNVRPNRNLTAKDKPFDEELA